MVLNLPEIVESGSDNLSKVLNLISYWFFFFFFFLGWGGVKGGISFLWIYWIYRMSWWKFYRIYLVSEKVREKILTFLWNVWVSRNIIVVSRESANFDVLRDRESGTSHESWFILIHKQDPFVDFCCLGLYYCQWALLAQMALSPPTSLDGGWVWGYKTHLVNF